MTIKTAIVGANGYSGRELARLLLQHPHVELTATLTRNSSWQLSDELPEAAAKLVPNYAVAELSQLAQDVDYLFFATPTDISLELVPLVIGQKAQLIDLSGAFRLPVKLFELWYGLHHSAPELIAQAQYGLSPWWTRSPSTPQLISNPGCYATCALMALLPLLQTQCIKANPIIIDGKSGLTGAGRKTETALLFCEMSEDFYAYKVGHHQHTPEIHHYLQHYLHLQNQLSPQDPTTAKPLLTTQLLPIKRGLSMSIYAHLADDYQNTSTAEIKNVLDQAYQQAYHDYPLAKFGYLNNKTAHDKSLLSLKQVVGSARVHIGYQFCQDTVIIFASIDNLLKGAASQAIENLNALLGLPLTTGLINHEGVL